MSEINHQSDVVSVEYPDRDDLPRHAPRDAGEVFDLVVRKGPISFDKLMSDQIYTMSRDEVSRSLFALRDADYVARVSGNIDEHGTTRDLWYVPAGPVTDGDSA